MSCPEAPDEPGSIISCPEAPDEPGSIVARNGRAGIDHQLPGSTGRAGIDHQLPGSGRRAGIDHQLPGSTGRAGIPRNAAGSGAGVVYLGGEQRLHRLGTELGGCGGQTVCNTGVGRSRAAGRGGSAPVKRGHQFGERVRLGGGVTLRWALLQALQVIVRILITRGPDGQGHDAPQHELEHRPARAASSLPSKTGAVGQAIDKVNIPCITRSGATRLKLPSRTGPRHILPTCGAKTFTR